jgi:serine/threonine-protein kinase PpkA
VAEEQTPKEVIAAPPGYKIIKKMGQGGMAAVYLAIQESFGRHVALKIMSDQLGQDPVWAKRFIYEAQTVAQLSHPNIVPVFDVGTFNGRFYISMELLKGGNLDDKIAKGITIPEIVKVIVGVAAGLDFAGEKGFVHRDIKPDNVMFREDGSPVILDFGIVKQKGGSGADKMTQTGTIVGTTAYMSPEQAMGKELDEGSDIYSLGIMFYELLAGRVPFHGDSAVAVLMKHVNEAPPPLPEFVSVFQPIIDRALAKKRDDRYPRARAMIEHIQELAPEIQQLMARQQEAFTQAGSNDATNVQSALGATKAMTRVSGKTTIKGTAAQKQAAETELTDVLSSAKATISNFSEEARFRKARNTRRAIIAAAVVVVLALSYVAYQQLYVVPHASEQAAKQRQEKIAELLSLAEDSMDKLVITDTKAADALITQYREVLVLDTENAEAHTAMNKLGEQYIELANQELTANNITQAETYRDYVEQLAPKNPQLAGLREALKNARASSTQQALEGEFKQQQIATLLSDAQNNIRAGQLFAPSEDNAYGKFQQILKLDPSNADAQNRINTLTGNLYTETQNAITAQQWRTVTANLELLDRVYPEKAKMISLKSNYTAAKQKADEQARLAGTAQRKQDLLNKITQLKKESRTRNSNGDLRDAAQSLLAMDAGNSVATAALEDANRFDVEQADKAIKQRDYARAAQHLGDLEKAAPSHASLADLKSKLTVARSAAQKADQLLASASELVNTVKIDDGKRQDLAKAYSMIDSAKQVDPNNTGIAPAISALENEYFLTIRTHIAAQQRDLVAAYFNDMHNKSWPTERIAQAELSWKSMPATAVAIPVEKPKPKRVMSGGF